MKCQKCGCSLPEDSEFCQYCGARLEPVPAAETVAASTEIAPIEKPIHKTASESTPMDLQAETVQEESLMSRAYCSYESTDPEERRFFEELLGSEELKAAYLEELERNQNDYDKGVCINFKRSYTQFMAVLHDEYFSTPQTIREGPAPAAEPAAPVATSMAEKALVLNDGEKQASCRKSGTAIASNTKKHSGLGKYFNTKKTAPILILTVLLIASIGLNVMQYLQGKEAMETVVSQTAQIEKLEKEISTQESTISSQKTTISSLKGTISAQINRISYLEEKSDHFDTICQELSIGNIGYAASNFKSSESVIVVDRNETNRKFTLTAHWTNGGTVSLDHSGSAAWVDFDRDSWTTSVKMTIEPWKEGVTAVTFSNDVDSKTFKVIIIVT